MGKREDRMSVKDAADLAETMDLPDGAYWAMVEDLAGIEPGYGPIAYIEGLEAEPQREEPPAEKRHACPQCGKRFRSDWSMKQHQGDAHQKEGRNDG